jgi:hypothetical protein
LPLKRYWFHIAVEIPERLIIDELVKSQN